MIPTVSGISASSSARSESRTVSENPTPGNGTVHDPKASITFSAVTDVFPVLSAETRTVCGPSLPLIEAYPLITVIPRKSIREARPETIVPVIFAFRSNSFPVSADTAVSSTEIPQYCAFDISSRTCAAVSSALVGIHPRFRQVPPRVASFSISAVFSPSSAARSAVAYPPGPAPITATS